VRIPDSIRYVCSLFYYFQKKLTKNRSKLIIIEKLDINILNNWPKIILADKNFNFRRSAIWRQTTEERKNADKLWDDIWNEHRQAAESHRTTRKHLQDFIKPGMTMIEIWWVSFSILRFCSYFRWSFIVFEKPRKFARTKILARSLKLLHELQSARTDSKRDLHSQLAARWTTAPRITRQMLETRQFYRFSDCYFFPLTIVFSTMTFARLILEHTWTAELSTLLLLSPLILNTIDFWKPSRSDTF